MHAAAMSARCCKTSMARQWLASRCKKAAAREPNGSLMETKWLEDFVSLAETRSFSRSAQLRHVTQLAFSRRIQSLEGLAVPIWLTAPPTHALDRGRSCTRRRWTCCNS
jgi:hypothetical protein